MFDFKGSGWFAACFSAYGSADDLAGLGQILIIPCCGKEVVLIDGRHLYSFLAKSLKGRDK